MQGKMVEKEELLAMLSEIFDQLEELESVLESNLSGLRQDWYYEQSEKIEACESRLEVIEEDMSAIKSEADSIESAKRSARMKLELGF
ncbi:hypothetical protein ACOSZF_02400 [Cytobacillus firmus]|uniref:hypothetical protein n=1 Tax=Cytobacillus firmus TaxID=1399 RepID=UPI00158010CC|nr:hypothetical protein [Cytobacillus firmus]MBG9546549.1 hypothetical protein [Cytobacillus firmus]MBG9602882.1 hypothetical protein [Cytobacillus firmus]MBG9655956.1 hypothetical protein [Cytobacillus firmus]MDD9311230.1 hypothetical protein [Cytobacillus firmus]MED1907338.1 hypothetical protein [Cytobacillus firmus]